MKLQPCMNGLQKRVTYLIYGIRINLATDAFTESYPT